PVPVAPLPAERQHLSPAVPPLGSLVPKTIGIVASLESPLRSPTVAVPPPAKPGPESGDRSSQPTCQSGGFTASVATIGTSPVTRKEPGGRVMVTKNGAAVFVDWSIVTGAPMQPGNAPLGQ